MSNVLENFEGFQSALLREERLSLGLPGNRRGIRFNPRSYVRSDVDDQRQKLCFRWFQSALLREERYKCLW